MLLGVTSLKYGVAMGHEIDQKLHFFFFFGTRPMFRRSPKYFFKSDMPIPSADHLLYLLWGCSSIQVTVLSWLRKCAAYLLVSMRSVHESVVKTQRKEIYGSLDFIKIDVLGTERVLNSKIRVDSLSVRF